MKKGKINHYGKIIDIEYIFVTDDEIEYSVNGRVFYSHYKSLIILINISLMGIKHTTMTIYLTAASIRAVLCYTNPNNTPKIAYDDDSLIEPLNNLLLETVGDKDGSQKVHLYIEEPLLSQFKGVCKNISMMTNMLSE